jgi:dihydroorotate dehydrogenase electron transfer subunit
MNAAGVPMPFQVKERIPESSKTVSLVLDGSLSCTPGQFAMLWLPGVDEKPFSISGNDPLMFTISQVGPFSQALHALCPGDLLWVRGPFGKGFSIQPGRALLVGGGYGAAPLAFLARATLAAHAPGGVEAALGARTAADLLFVERFRAMDVPIHAATEDGSEGAAGLVTDEAGKLLASGGFSCVQACGPEGMLEALAHVCSAAGVPAELSFEAYMRCGIGLCGACEHAGKLVCMDGPVFSLAEVPNAGPPPPLPRPGNRDR